MSPEESRGYICAIYAIISDGPSLEAAMFHLLDAKSEGADDDFTRGWIRACEEYVK